MLFNKRKNKEGKEKFVSGKGDTNCGFHITVKENKTGEFIVDMDTDAILGGILRNENNAFVLGVTCCPPKQVLGTVMAALNAIKQLENTTHNETAKKLLRYCIVESIKKNGWVESGTDQSIEVYTGGKKDDGFFS